MEIRKLNSYSFGLIQRLFQKEELTINRSFSFCCKQWVAIFTLLLISWASVERANGQIVFSNQQIISNEAISAISVFAADLNGNGLKDVLSASAGDDKIAWYANNGAGGFGPQQVITTLADGAWSVFAADLNGNGHMDVLSASTSDDKIAWYANNGAGGFGPQQVITNQADGARSVYAADLNGNGLMDVLSASSSDNKIAWYANDGAGGFEPQQVISTEAMGAFSVFAADLNGDGHMDVLSASFSDNKIAWYENDGAGGFGPQQVIATNASVVQSVFAADLNGNGHMDVLSASAGDNKIAWYENDGTGGFGPTQVITNAANNARSVYAADLNGNGHMDVLSASFNDNKIAWYENNGAGGFGQQQVITTNANGARSVYAADLNGNGHMDVLSASPGDSKVAWYEQLKPILSADPTSVTLSSAEGQQLVDIINEGVGSFSWSASITNGNWVSLINASGTDETEDLVFTYNANPDTTVRTAEIEIVAEGVENSPLTISITQEKAPYLGVEVTNLTVGSNQGQVSFHVENEGGGSSLQWEAAIISGNWITLAQNSGSDADDVVVNYAENTAASVRTAEIELTSGNAAGGPITLLIEQVTEPLILAVNPEFVTVEPVSSSFTVDIIDEGGGNASLSWEASVLSGDWITLTTPNGASVIEDLEFAYDANSTLNSRTAEIEITSAVATNSPKIITVEQEGRPSLAVDQIQKFVGYSEGMVSYNIINEGGGTLVWNAFPLEEWISIENTTGTQDDNLVVSFNTNMSQNTRGAQIILQASDILGQPFDEILLSVVQEPLNLEVQLFEVLTDTIRPSFVNVLFQATDPFGNGVPFLDKLNPATGKPNFFTLTEEGNIIKEDDAESDFRILKQDAIDFTQKTALVLDQSASIGFENLPQIKEAAKSLIREIEDTQEVAIYTFTSQVQLIQTFTSDTTALISAIDEIELAGGSTNLFGGVVTAAEDLEPLLIESLEEIVRGNIVVFTDGKENTGQFNISDVQNATIGLDVFAVGVGADVDQLELEQITGFSGRVFQAEHPDLLAIEFRQIQQNIANLSNSFYWINYITPRRFGTNDIVLEVDGNNFTGTNSLLETSFSAEGFSDISPQVVVNQDFPEIFGTDTIFVPADSAAIASAATILSGNTPAYTWQSSDESIAVISPIFFDGREVLIIPRGLSGESTTITVTDTENTDFQGNLLSKTITVILTENTEPDVPSTVILISPENSSADVSIRPVFEWNESERATSYHLQLAIDENFSTLTADRTGISGTTFEPSEDLEADKDYYWRVRSENEAGFSNWSEVNVFTTQMVTSLIDDSNIPGEFILSQNYPNPFNPSTVIEFALPNASMVQLEVFNALGQRVALLVNEQRSAGFHQVMFDASNMASGMYIYRLQAGDFIQTKKLTLIK